MTRLTLVRSFVLLGALVAFGGAWAEDDKSKIDLYGFVMLDMGFDFNQNDPLWFDVMRPTKLPAFDQEFGEDGRFYSGVRQSRLGVKSWIPTKNGEIYTIFEFELFGVGVDAGQTTFRLRHAYGQWQGWGAGQTWSPFMDIDVFPNSIEYWGPNGMVFFRNVQIRYMPMEGDHEVVVALERPGASGDSGVAFDVIAGQAIQGRFPAPDLSGHYRWNQNWGHIQASAMVRYIAWDDTVAGGPDLSGNDIGWGLHASMNYKINKDTLRSSVVFGEGIQNYMNDAPADIGATGDPLAPEGEALGLIGLVAFYDRTWNDRMTSSFGYSLLRIDNSDLQSPAAFKTGQYALANIMFYPVNNLMFGPELQWGQRKNNSDGWSVNDFRVQFSVKYNFGKSWGG